MDAAKSVSHVLNLARIIASIKSVLGYALKFVIDRHVTSLAKRSFLVDTIVSAFVVRNALLSAEFNRVSSIENKHSKPGSEMSHHLMPDSSCLKTVVISLSHKLSRSILSLKSKRGT